MEESRDSTDAHPRPKVTNACEACRAAKVKCQASNQLGICRRCLESRRECIFKTGPRVRRPRMSKLADPSIPRPPPPPGPSKTFTIDIPMAEVEDPGESFDLLASQHENFIDTLIPEMLSEDEELGEGLADRGSLDGSGSGSSLPLGASATYTPPGSGSSKLKANSSRTAASVLGLQPQFNVDSAAKLLKFFTGLMLENFPCVSVPESATVAYLSKSRPFVLLAILAAASSSSSLQGHSLYDEEFRKILGLKFVAGGERSLELLMGLVIYVAWYPFHLRPKNRQAFQYLRMAVDIINDLELDQDPYPDEPTPIVSEEQLAEIRTYVAAYHLVCTFATAWNRQPALRYTPYIKKCCDILENQESCRGDLILAWQVRLQRIVEETHTMRRNAKPTDAAQVYQHKLMLKGMEAEMDQWETAMPQTVRSALCTRLQFLLARIFLRGATLLKVTGTAKQRQEHNAYIGPLESADLVSRIPLLRELYNLYSVQSRECLNALSCISWGAVVLSLILGYRMSFPIAGCAIWDDAAVRRDLKLDECLEKMCRAGGTNINMNTLTPASARKNMDVMSASQLVMHVLLRKYQRRVAKIERRDASTGDGTEARAEAVTPPLPGADFLASAPMPPNKAKTDCPMIDGSLESFYPLWDETFVDPSLYADPLTNLVPDGQAMAMDLGAGGMAGLGDDGQIQMGGMGADGGPDQLQGGLVPDIWATMTMGWAQNEISFDNM